jgi:glycosyltransferase involved in cell wall biosynthesis
VVVPVYNSEGSLEALVARLERVLLKLATEFEVILVNDGSRDKSWQVIQALAQNHACVLGINLMRNYGQHNALLAGIRQASVAMSL